MRGLRRAAGAVAAVALAGVWLAPVPAHADVIRDSQGPVLVTLGMETAWKVTKGDGVTVAVLDSGVDANHPDLKGSVTTGPNMIKEIDDGAAPLRVHGTAMASLIAGHGHGPGGRDGVIGMAPEASVLSIRVIAEEGDENYRRFRTTDEAEDALARGIRYAVDHGADVINLSLGGPGAGDGDRAAIGYAIGKGVVVVAAVGNDGDKERFRDEDGFTRYSYPASYPGVIAVAATRLDGTRAEFSNRNYSVLLSAPGQGLVAARPGDGYHVSSGTSDSTALVSGIAALIRARYPDLPPALVSQALIESTGNGRSRDYDAGLGFGTVHASRALAAAGALSSADARADEDKPAGQRFGADPGPVEVIERPAWVRPLIIVIVLAGIGGTAAAGAISLAFRRRHPKPPPRPPAAEPPRRGPGTGGPPMSGRPFTPYGPPYGGGGRR
ncbi:S8 family peptidase [Actinomadura livida]|uniref:Type VII secretion-associated serine protease mycosin n=1 Tax=Actinomadura livida TaxID=79909 RepID=A0A7W7IAL6_9ACTN|nr:MULTISPECIES: S8 family serine peptidase [Actinomadura]MBB4773489.1 type VII secretion-associated serine protease mycosin [Actinomadura catellatispora]